MATASLRHCSRTRKRHHHDARPSPIPYRPIPSVAWICRCTSSAGSSRSRRSSTSAAPRARLNLTQPPLSRQVQALEAALGVSALRPRRAAGCGSTRPVRCSWRTAAACSPSSTRRPIATRRAADGETGALRLAFTAIGAYAVLGDFLALVHERLPAVGVALTELASPGQFELLAGSELDLGLVRPPIPEQFASVLVHSEDLVLAVPDGHPLATAGRPRRARRRHRRLHRLQPRGLALPARHLRRHDRDEPVPGEPARVPGADHARPGAGGTGCALIPRSITAMGVHGVRYLELAAADAHSVTLHACWSPDNPNPALQRLVESLP